MGIRQFVVIVAFAPQGITGIFVMHNPIVRIKPRLMYKLALPYFYFILSILVLIVGFTTFIELVHSLNHDKGYTYAYWIKLNNSNFIIWIISISINIFGFIACKKSFANVKSIWNQVILEIKKEISK